MKVYVFYKADRPDVYALTKSKNKAEEFKHTRDMSKFVMRTMDISSEEYESDEVFDYKLKYFKLKDNTETVRVLSNQNEINDVIDFPEDTFVYLMSHDFVEKDIDSNLELSIFKNKYRQLLLKSIEIDSLIEFMMDCDSNHVPFDILSYNQVSLYCELYKELYKKEC